MYIHERQQSMRMVHDHARVPIRNCIDECRAAGAFYRQTCPQTWRVNDTCI